jgi:hypothetical protein
MESKESSSTLCPGESVRVGGDLEVQTTGESGNYRCGRCVVDTELPEGYPRPTPPGALELKSYPPVRLAEVKSTGNPDQGMNKSFWPLFRHIQRHDIPMTSPVEMSYTGLRKEEPTRPSSWSMAFLYRSPDLHGTGPDGNVQVRDAAPVTVIAAGLKGNYSMALVEEGMERVEAWLGQHPEWEVAGEWRTLYYNGPALMFWNKWAEVQLPVRRAGAKGAS